MVLGFTGLNMSAPLVASKANEVFWEAPACLVHNNMVITFFAIDKELPLVTGTLRNVMALGWVQDVTRHSL